MISLGVTIFIALGLALLAIRRKLSMLQSNFFGGSIGPGCIVAEASFLFLIAALIFLFRHSLQ